MRILYYDAIMYSGCVVCFRDRKNLTAHKTHLLNEVYSFIRNFADTIAAQGDKNRKGFAMSELADDKLSRGVKVLHDPVRNKGTAFTDAERDLLGLRGLLPPRIHTIAEQELRVLGNIRSKVTDLEKYLFLIALQDRNESLFYRVLMSNIEELMPLIYTPTVGKACQEFGHIFRRPRGLFISLNDRGRIAEILKNWPHKQAQVIVVTDGERILGLGDQGADGMGIPIGKLSLYTACAGIHPTQCLPITIDVGTNNETLLNDPLYIGLERRRERSNKYDQLIEEFITAAEKQFPDVLIQLEDFGNLNAFRLLQVYREQSCLFDDDIQGTGAVGLAGLLSALRITGGVFEEQRILFFGAGQAAIGIGNTVVAAMVAKGMAIEKAKQCCWYFDTKGLLTSERENIAQQKQPYAHKASSTTDFLQAIRQIKPTAIIGASGQAGAFSELVIKAMLEINTQPIIFALSNPTSKAECTAQQCYRSSNGMAVFASGSPFDPVQIENHTFVSGQGNNVYIFPGVGLGIVASKAQRVTDEMFLIAAQTLADLVTEDDLKLGRVYPALSKIREVSTLIAAAVADVVYQQGLTNRERPDDILADIHQQMYQPVYPHYA